MRAGRKPHTVAEDFAAISPVGPERTVERTVARKLRDLIAEGKLEQGLRLRYRDLAERFGVSVTPVRIALRDLAKEGFVELAPDGGARVSPLSLEELEEVYAARAGLEGLIARLGAVRMSDEGVGVMMTRLAELERFAEKSERGRYLDAIWAYKLTCYESAGRSRLLETVSLLVRRSARYNALALGEKYRFEESLVFQRRFGETCERRDGPAAELVIREAMDWSRTYLTGKLAASGLRAAWEPETGGTSR